MRLFAGIWKKNSAEAVQVKGLERGVLESALLYAEHLRLPEPSGKAVAYLTEQKKKDASGGYCIRFLSDGTKAGDLDAGYLAGQIAAFLRFQGNTEIRIHRIQENGRETTAEMSGNGISWKMRCRAVLTSGSGEAGRRRKRSVPSPEQGIYTEKRENWHEELLAYTKLQYPGTYRRLVVRCADGWIHFSEKRPAGMHSFADAFDAGLAAAQIMAAAEMLWVELELSREISEHVSGKDSGKDSRKDSRKEADYLFSVRMKEKVPKEQAELSEYTEHFPERSFGKEAEKECIYHGKTSVGFA